MIRGVFFDLDGTLYDRDAAIQRMAEQQFETVRDLLPGIHKSVFVERLVELDGHGYRRPGNLHHLLAESLGRKEAGDRLEECFRTHYPQQCRITAEDFRTLQTLSNMGVKLALVTNGPVEWQRRKIESMHIAPLFDAILISQEEGVAKPDTRIFMRALERCGVTAAETLFVGDHPENDIAGAEAGGLRPIWKRTPYWEVPEHVAQIDAINEVLSLL